MSDRKKDGRDGMKGLVVACLLATLGLGLAKVQLQRLHPPAYARAGQNTYQGFVSIDQYCLRAERLRACVLEPGPPARAALLEDLRTRGHSTAILVPILVAAASLLTGSIPIAFVLLSALALVAQVRLVWALGAELARRSASPAHVLWAGTAAVLVAAHVNTARSAAQLLLDPFAAALTTAAVLLALRHVRRARPADAAGLAAVLLAGALVKISFLPALAVPAVVHLLAGRAAFSARVGRAFVASVACALPALLAAWLYVVLVPGWSVFTFDMSVARPSSAMSQRELWSFGIEMALLLQLAPLVLLRNRRVAAEPAVRATLAFAALLLASLWWHLGLAHDQRLNLPLVGLLAAGCAGGVVAVAGPRRLVAILALFAAANYAVATAGLVHQLY